MLTRCAKAYNSCCSQTVSISLATSSQFILEVWPAKRLQKSLKLLRPILEDQGLSKSPMPIRLKCSSLVLVVISSMPMVICN